MQIFLNRAGLDEAGEIRWMSISRMRILMQWTAWEAIGRKFWRKPAAEARHVFAGIGIKLSGSDDTAHLLAGVGRRAACPLRLGQKLRRLSEWRLWIGSVRWNLANYYLAVGQARSADSAAGARAQ